MSKGIGLEGTKIKVDRTHMLIDEYCRTGEPGVYAIGDLAGPPWLAHKASHEGVLCVEKIAGLNDCPPDRLDATFPAAPIAGRRSHPSGSPKKKPRKPKGAKSKSAASRSSATARRSRWASPKGMVKTVFDADTGELLGAHMIGAEVTELIQGYAVARTLESTEVGSHAHGVPASDR